MPNPKINLDQSTSDNLAMRLNSDSTADHQRTMRITPANDRIGHLLSLRRSGIDRRNFRADNVDLNPPVRMLPARVGNANCRPYKHEVDSR